MDFRRLLRWFLGRAADDGATAPGPATEPSAARDGPATEPSAARDGPKTPEPDRSLNGWSGEDLLAPWEGVAQPPTLEAAGLRAYLHEMMTDERSQVHSGPDLAFISNLQRALDERALCLPPFPAGARKVQEILRDTEPRTLDLVVVVESDPGLLSRVWTRASATAFREPPSRVDQAIARVGLDQLWRIAWKTCVDGLSFDAPGFREASEEVLFQGRVAAEVTARLSGDRRGAPYLAGLLHDVGKLVVYRSSNNETSRALVDRIAHRHHAAIGALAATVWGLEPAVVEAIAASHHGSRTSAELPRLIRVVDIAIQGALAPHDISEQTVERWIQLVAPGIDAADVIRRVAGAIDFERGVPLLGAPDPRAPLAEPTAVSTVPA